MGDGANLKDRLVQVLLDAEYQVNRHIESFLTDKNKGVDRLKWRILEALTGGESLGLSMKALSEITYTNDSTLTKVVDKMVQDALVYRRPDPGDRRKVLIFKSHRGRALHARLKKEIYGCYDDIFSAYSDEQICALQQLLQPISTVGAPEKEAAH